MGASLQRELLASMARHGRDGEGEGKLAGFLDWVVRNHPREYIGLIGRMVPRLVQIEEMMPSSPPERRTPEEVRVEIEALGFTIYDKELPEAIMKYSPIVNGKFQIVAPDPDDPDDEGISVPIPKLRPPNT